MKSAKRHKDELNQLKRVLQSTKEALNEAEKELGVKKRRVAEPTLPTTENPYVDLDNTDTQKVDEGGLPSN